MPDSRCLDFSLVLVGRGSWTVLVARRVMEQRYEPVMTKAIAELTTSTICRRRCVGGVSEFVVGPAAGGRGGVRQAANVQREWLPAGCHVGQDSFDVTHVAEVDLADESEHVRFRSSGPVGYATAYRAWLQGPTLLLRPWRPPSTGCGPANACPRCGQGGAPCRTPRTSPQHEHALHGHALRAAAQIARDRPGGDGGGPNACARR